MKLHFYIYPLLAVLVISLSSCVSQQEYTEMQDQLKYYKKDASLVDSLTVQNDRLQSENDAQNAEYGHVIREMESLRAANINLNRSYQENLQKLNKLQSAHDEAVSYSSYSNLGTSEELAQCQSKLDQSNRTIARMEYELYQKEQLLNRYGATGKIEEFDTDSRFNEKSVEAETLYKQQETNRALLNTLAQQLSPVFTNYNAEDANMKMQEGYLQLTLSTDFLFDGINGEMTWQGRSILSQIATRLKNKTGMDYLVIGHTDNQGTSTYNWSTSTDRAISVVKFFTNNGVPAQNLTAGGQAFYAPIASNETASGRKTNRRIEIIITAQ